MPVPAEEHIDEVVDPITEDSYLTPSALKVPDHGSRLALNVVDTYDAPQNSLSNPSEPVTTQEAKRSTSPTKITSSIQRSETAPSWQSLPQELRNSPVTIVQRSETNRVSPLISRLTETLHKSRENSPNILQAKDSYSPKTFGSDDALHLDRKRSNSLRCVIEIT